MGEPMKKRRLSLAVLTPNEETKWLNAFEWHLLHGKRSGTESARLAWKDVKDLFPRLREYDGAK